MYRLLSRSLVLILSCSATLLLGQPDCDLPPAVPSLLPNPSLENFDPLQEGCLSQQPGGLPDATNQANCLTGWQRASLGTTDAWNAFTLPGAPPLFPASLPQPLPSGTGLAGFWVGVSDAITGTPPLNDGEGTGYREYLAACLTDQQRLVAGQEYRMTFFLGFTEANADPTTGLEVGSPSPVRIAVYGIRECGQLNYGDSNECPEAAGAGGWELIRNVEVSGEPGSWSEVDLRFPAAADYAGIAIGGSCGDDPGADRVDYRNYYFIDEIRLNVPAAFEQPVAGPVSVSGRSICDDRITLTGTAAPGAAYQWFKDGELLAGRTDRTLELNGGPDIDGGYRLRIATAAGCALSDEVVVQRPVLTDQVPDSVALCTTQDTVVIVPRGFNFLNQFNWSDGSDRPTLPVTEAGNYSVTVSNSCEQRVEEFVVIADGVPTYRMVSEPANACPGDTVTVSIASDWYFPFANFEIDGAFAPTIAFHQVRLVVQPGGSVVRTQLFTTCAIYEDSIVLNDLPIELTATVPELSCENPSGTIELTAADPDVIEYSWSGPSGEPLGATGPQLTVSVAGDYVVELMDGVRCPRTDTFRVVFNDDFDVGVDPTGIACGDDGTAIARVSGGTAPYTVDWFREGEATAFASGVDSVGSLSQGNYRINVTDASGCELPSTFTIVPVDSLTLTGAVSFADCSDSSSGILALNASGGTGPYRYFVDGVEQSAPVITDLGEGTYRYSVTDGNGCSTEPLTIAVTPPTPYTLTGPADAQLTQGDTTVLGLTLTGLTFADGTITWSPAAGLSCLNCPDPRASPLVTTRYVATFLSNERCEQAVEVVVSVDGSLRYFAPTAFSPNDDGNNDEFRLFFGSSVRQIEAFRVYDRWGEMVWEQTEGPTTGWDGTFRGRALDPAAFAYVATLVLVDGRRETVTGTVVLLQ